MMLRKTGVEAEAGLRRQLAGKRDGIRIERAMDLVAEVSDSCYLVRSVNISRSGMLIDVPDMGLLRHLDPSCLLGDGGRIRRQFRWSILLRIGNVTCRAMVVRIIPGEVIQLGCCFRLRLPRVICNTLGVPDSSDAAP